MWWMKARRAEYVVGRRGTHLSLGQHRYGLDAGEGSPRGPEAPEAEHRPGSPIGDNGPRVAGVVPAEGAPEEALGCFLVALGAGPVEHVVALTAEFTVVTRPVSVAAIATRAPTSATSSAGVNGPLSAIQPVRPGWRVAHGEVTKLVEFRQGHQDQ